MESEALIMSNFVWCHGPSCHKSHTQDRIRGVKGSKVLRTKKVQQYSDNINMYSYFCSQGCYNDFANKYVQQVIAIAPRTEALETPIEVTKVQDTYWNNETYMRTEIKTVDTNGG
jgi:YHS domain-containing protein